MARYNDCAFKRTLMLDGDLTNFWHYTTGSVVYDEDTQVPTYDGTIVSTYADVLDFTINEIKNASGLIDLNSKKFIIPQSIDLTKGDEVLDENNTETYKIVFVTKFKNRTHLFGNKIEENPNTHN